MHATYGPVASLLLGVAFLLSGHGIQITLVPLRAAAEGWSPFEIGVIGSAYYLGFTAGCIGTPYVILRAGHIRAFAAFVSLCSAVTILQAVVVAVIPWIVFRLLIGVVFAGLFMVTESWLNDRATNENRGRIMAAYITVNFAAITVGQFMVTLAAPTAFTLFAFASIAVSLAAIPVALTRSAQPAPIPVARLRPRELYARSPVGLVGVTVVGVANGAFWSLLAVYAVGEGLDSRQVAIFTGLATIAGALAQWPAGRVSDRVDRRIVLIVLLVLASAVGLALAFLPVAGGLWIPLAILFGLTTLPTYAVSAAHAYDHAPPGGYVATAAGLLLANGFGAVVGPILAAGLMEATSTAMLFLFTAFAQSGLALFAIARMRMRAAPDSPAKTEFDLAATAPVGAVIPPELLNPEDEHVAVPEEQAPVAAWHKAEGDREGHPGASP